MNVRLAACEPCRQAKLACGHERPTCSRCINRGQHDSCAYRMRPFRRKNLGYHSRKKSLSKESSPASPLGEHLLLSPQREVSTTSAQKYRYPNPGFLGTSSHSTLFNQVSSHATSDPATQNHDGDAQSSILPSPTDMLENQAIVDRAVRTLSRLVSLDVSNLNRLVHAWLGRGVNLPLAELFVPCCSDAMLNSRELLRLPAASCTSPDVGFSHCASFLLGNTHKPIILSTDSSPTDILAQMVGDNLRWETLGIFFTAASRACLDTSAFTPLYTGQEQRRVLIKSLTYMSDCCLETCLALDHMNDLQLILQYENFIVHSQVDGDQSYHSWRRMGDVASSLFALGYHEKVNEATSTVPAFVAELRKACFARIYAADKSLAIFLGRPPRIVKEYCYFQVPTNLPGIWGQCAAENSSDNPPPQQIMNRNTNHKLDDTETINYMADTRCSALFACLKEEILQLFRSRHSRDQTDRAGEIRIEVERQWQELPAHFRLADSLKNCHRGPFERDFLVGTRLDYLHTLFLLELSSQRKISEPDVSILKVAGEMLSHVVELIILRDCLVNSGTCLIWKVAQYGLPAAGIISLALLNASVSASARPVSRSKMVQDLSVLVAEITIGAWIQAGDPNFALFTRATRAIQSLLDSLITWKPHATPLNLSSDFMEDWDPYFNFQSWDFEMDFWNSLAEHPTLLN